MKNISKKDLIARLNKTKTGELKARCLAECGDKNLSREANDEGVWLASDSFGKFRDDLSDSQNYESGVRTLFTAWLERNGWFLECEDFGTYYLFLMD